MHKDKQQNAEQTILMNLPLLDPFSPPYEVWSTRTPTYDEMIASSSPAPIKENLLATISDAETAAAHIACGVSDNGLSNHINTVLSKSPVYKEWQRAMPSKTPAAISKYQTDYTHCDLDEVSKEIELYGVPLNPGQCLFHGGLWTGGSSTVTGRPLSTSLCPQVALKNAEYKAKAYDAGRLDLIVLRITDLTTKAFVFKKNGTKLGHEREVLMASGLLLTLKNVTLIRPDHLACKYNFPDKAIPIHVVRVDVSLAV